MISGDSKSIKVIVYVENEEPFTADMDAVPPPHSTHILVRNPQTREGRSVGWISRGARAILFPMSRIMFIEVIRDDEGNVEYPWKPTAPLPGQ